MGKNSRRGRAANQRRDSGRSTYTRSSLPVTETSGAASDQAQILQLIRLAEMFVAGSPRAAHRHIETLVTLSQTATDPRLDPAVLMVDEALSMIGDAYESGWQPLDLLHAVRRRGSVGASTWLGTAVTIEARRSRAAERAPKRWIDQLEQVRGGSDADRTLLAGEAITEWTDAIMALAVLHRLPRLEHLVPPPSEWVKQGAVREPLRANSPAGNKVLTRVRALLAKAESTTFPAEAEALTAKAQDLMARHSIDEALVRAAEGADTEITTARVLIENPYAKEKAVLLHVVAVANRTRAVWHDWASFVTIVGESKDLDQVEMMFTSTLVQATRAMVAAGSGNASADRSTGFRKSFLNAYAARIGQRLSTSTQDAERSYGQNVLPVLARQEEAIDNTVSELFPRLRTGGGTQSFDARGWHAGTQAADAAVLPAGQVGA